MTGTKLQEIRKDPRGLSIFDLPSQEMVAVIPAGTILYAGGNVSVEEGTLVTIQARGTNEYDGARACWRGDRWVGWIHEKPWAERIVESSTPDEVVEIVAALVCGR